MLAPIARLLLQLHEARLPGLLEDLLAYGGVGVLLRALAATTNYKSNSNNNDDDDDDNNNPPWSGAGSDAEEAKQQRTPLPLPTPLPAPLSAPLSLSAPGEAALLLLSAQRRLCVLLERLSLHAPALRELAREGEAGALATPVLACGDKVVSLHVLR